MIEPDFSRIACFQEGISIIFEEYYQEVKSKEESHLEKIILGTSSLPLYFQCNWMEPTDYGECRIRTQWLVSEW